MNATLSESERYGLTVSNRFGAYRVIYEIADRRFGLQRDSWQVEYRCDGFA